MNRDLYLRTIADAAEFSQIHYVIRKDMFCQLKVYIGRCSEKTLEYSQVNPDFE